MNIRLVLYGAGIWVGGTAALRIGGRYMLNPGNPTRTVCLFAVSFIATAWLVRRLCQGFHLRREEWPAGAVAVLLPTLVLDPFSAAFFSVVFPNMPPEAAGLFGGWMLICCAGGLAGATIRRRTNT